jgi:hypothetical protein
MVVSSGKTWTPMMCLLCLMVGVLHIQRVSGSYVRQRRQVWPGDRGINVISKSDIDLSGAFTLEQELGVKYSIGLLPYDGKPLSDGNRDGDIIQLKSENGTLFDCHVVDEEKSGETREPDAETTITEARRVLDSLSNWCAYRVEGWWTYEVCYKKKVRQYHVDVVNGNDVSADFLLGTYSDMLVDLSMKDIKNTSEWDGSDSSDVFVSDLCDNGDVCDLEEVGGPLGMKRTVEVRYYCGSSVQPMLVDVKEPRSCHYIFDVRMASLCSVPGLTSKIHVPLRQIECKQHVMP